MADLIQALADGLFNFLLIFEDFLDMLDNINFLDSGYSLLVFFYSIALIQFILDLFNNFILGDQDEEPDTVSFVQNDDSDDFSLGMTDD
jgi:hypothetical protein